MSSIDITLFCGVLLSGFETIKSIDLSEQFS